MNEPEYKIEKGIPIPIGIKPGGVVDTLMKMEPGDSILVPGNKRTNLHNIARQRSIKIVCRIQPSGEYRVWRKS